MNVLLPSQKIDTHVWENPKQGSNDRCVYHHAYQAGVLMGRGLQALGNPLLAALRRYLFFGQPIPAWVHKLVYHHTHIIFYAGVYVRVLWVSPAQMEELFIFIHQCYKVASRKKGKWEATPDH